MTAGTEHRAHAGHPHVHGPDCGHVAFPHQDHVDYAHDSHVHRAHGDHVDECVSAVTFVDLSRYVVDRFLRWARRKHRRITIKTIRRRHCNGGWWPSTTEIGLFDPAKMRTTRYRYRGAAIPAPWPVSG